MSLKNIANLPHLSSIEDTDLIFCQGGTSKTVAEWKLYAAEETSEVDDADVIMCAEPGSSGKERTALQLKSFFDDDTTPITGTMVIPVLRGSVIYNVTVAELTAFVLFDISQVSNLIGWYKISDPASITTGSGRATTINDKSGSGMHLTNTGGVKPLYFATGGGNNKGYIKIDSTAEIFCPSAIPGGWSNTRYFYIVFKHVSGSSVVINDFSGTATHGMKVSSTGKFSITGYGGGISTGRKDSIRTGEWQIVKVNFSTTPSTRFGVNNEIFDQYNYDYTNGGLSAQDMVRIGLGWRASQSIEVHISEMVICNGAPSDFNDTNIRKKLCSEYGITSAGSIGWFGDSITKGAAATDQDATSFAALCSIAKGKTRCDFSYPGGNICTPYTGYDDVPVESGTSFIDKVEHFINLVNKGYDVSQITDVVITYGTNDTAHADTSDNRIGWKAVYKATVQRLITEAGIAANKIILCYAPYSSTRAASLAILNPLISEIASELGLRAVVDLTAATLAGGGDSLLTDGTHINNTGHDICADEIIPQLS